jgi:hypothetical protein
MERVITYNFGENFIEKIANFLYDNFSNKSRDFSRIAVIFGGRRPSLFLRRALAEKIKDAFYPPRSFAIDEFMQYVVSKDSQLERLGELDTSYLIYQITRQKATAMLKGRQNFSEFLPWARQIHSFIEQVDLENIDDKSLIHVEKSASIGYDIPPDINVLLEHINGIRIAYHDYLTKEKKYSRGWIYLEASRLVKERAFGEFDAVIFCNFFYLHRTELEVMKEVYRKEKAVFIFQGTSAQWPVLAKNAQELNISIATEKEIATQPELSLYQGFDMHSQICLVREILSKIKDKENTVIILPRPQALIALLSEVSSLLNGYNVSMGYPLEKSSIYVLLEALAKSQNSRKAGKYYAKDYLNLLRHPLAKNLRLKNEPQVTRVIVHKIEELLQGREESSIGGSLFLSLSKIENEEKIYFLAKQTLRNIGIDLEEAECKENLKELHNLFFRIWEDNDNLLKFSASLQCLLDTLINNSMLAKFPFNLKIIEKLDEIKIELESISFKEEIFEGGEIWDIFRQKLRNETISFIGSPLKGAQILGFLEARSLCFKNVIVMDVNESILPTLKINDPLIPREVMLNLGLNRLEKEEEIQRYQFNSLIQSAVKVHLVYEKNEVKEKSRFIEELFWKMQKERRSLEVINIPRASFSVNVMPKAISIPKTAENIDFMKRATYSASRVNTYMNCPLQFYFQYVLGLEEKSDLLEEPEAPHIGDFIHELLEETFAKFKNSTPLLDKRFEKYFFERMEEKFENDLGRRMKTDSFLLKRIIRNRLERFLESERKRNVAKIICLEEKRKDTLAINNEEISFVYTVDRIDQMQNESIIIIDYKTGGANVSPKRFQTLEKMSMDIESIKEDIRSFQLPLYYHFVSRQLPDKEVNAQLYSLRTLERKSFISEADSPHKSRIMEVCLKALGVVFQQMFNPDIAFTPSKEEQKCGFCGFSALCK